MTRMFCLLALLLASLPAAHAGGGAPAPAAEEAPSRGGRSITHVESYVPFDPILAAVQSDMRLRGVIHIELGLNTEDASLRAKIEQRMARLRNAYNSSIAVYTGVHYRFGEMPDPDLIASMLQRATDETLGQDGAEVLLSLVMVNGR